MKVDIMLKHANTAAKVELEPGEQITAEGGSMIAMTNDLSLETTTYKKGKGGIGKALKRIFAGESFFMNHYTAGANGGTVYLAQSMPGDMINLDMSEQKIVVQAGSFVAAAKDVTIDTGWQGFKNIISKESLFWVELSGKGNAILSSYGAIYQIDVEDDYIVDTGHIVAFDETLDFKLSKAGKSWISSILGGEGLVCRFSGKGRVWCQSHNQGSLGNSLTPKLRPR